LFINPERHRSEEETAISDMNEKVMHRRRPWTRNPSNRVTKADDWRQVASY